MVPERATKSFTESPWLAKFVLKALRLRKCAGIELLGVRKLKLGSGLSVKG
jgi:hypothetical protein